MDVLIAGGGPAGWSLASACARRGLRVTLVAATHGWPATYGMWLDETGCLPPGARWVTARPRGLSRDYVVLDNDSVLAGFAHPGIEVVKARAAAMTASHVRLADGTELTGDLVFDATGVLGTAGRVEQTAYGVVVSEPHEAVFMDWRQPPGFGEPATFLYAMPLPDGRTLLEETCLARRPGLGFAELRARLHARLGPLTGPTERVRFPVDIPPPPRIPRHTQDHRPLPQGSPHPVPGAPRHASLLDGTDKKAGQRGLWTTFTGEFERMGQSCGPVPFGAAGGFVHPATGFSLADTFRLAPLVADTIGRGARAVRRVLWPERARIVYRLRRRGLSTLLSLTAAETEEFFDLFFALPEHHRRAYLSGRTDVAATAAAMAALFAAAPAHLRRKMIKP